MKNHLEEGKRTTAADLIRHLHCLLDVLRPSLHIIVHVQISTNMIWLDTVESRKRNCLEKWILRIRFENYHELAAVLPMVVYVEVGASMALIFTYLYI